MCRLEPGESVVALASLAPDAAALAVGTAQGVVKRVAPDYPGNRDGWDVIALKPGDSVVGAGAAGDDGELVFITSDAQLLHFPAGAVRPQGRAAGGMAGIKLGGGAEAIWFGVVTDLAEALVVTVAGTSGTLPGTQPGSAKVTPLDLYPAKGRGTGGVRAHRFIRGEDTLLLGWVGAGPAHATGAAGQPLPLPDPDLRRDGSGLALAAPVHAVG
jgi:DNA gyrase subunit A